MTHYTDREITALIGSRTHIFTAKTQSSALRYLRIAQMLWARWLSVLHKRKSHRWAAQVVRMADRGKA